MLQNSTGDQLQDHSVTMFCSIAFLMPVRASMLHVTDDHHRVGPDRSETLASVFVRSFSSNVDCAPPLPAPLNKRRGQRPTFEGAAGSAVRNVSHGRVIPKKPAAGHRAKRPMTPRPRHPQAAPQADPAELLPLAGPSRAALRTAAWLRLAGPPSPAARAAPGWPAGSHA